MKKKFSKILGVGLAFMLVVSLMAFALPVLADPDEEFAPEPNEWTDYVFKAGSASDWRLQGTATADELIEFIGPIAQSPIDGDLYAYVGDDADTPRDLLKSEDGGRTWAASTSTTKSYHLVSGDPIVDMVCSSMDEDILYVTDGNYVYKSVDGGDTFAKLAAESLEAVLEGECGCTITHLPITCLDVGYDVNDNPLVFIGTKHTYDGTMPFVGCNHDGPPSVLYIAEAVYPVEWNDLILDCYSCGGYTPYAVGVTPDFADTGEVMVVVSQPLTMKFYENTAGVITITAGTGGATFSYTALPGDVSGPGSPVSLGSGGTAVFNADSTHVAGESVITLTAGSISWEETSGTAAICDGTFVVSTKGTICHWIGQAEILWDCLWSFDISAASRIGYPDDWSDSETLYVGVVGAGGTTEVGGDVYSVTAPSALDLNVAGYLTGCEGVAHRDIISLDVVGEAEDARLIAGVHGEYRTSLTTTSWLSMLYYSTDGGWEWDHCDKCPSGENPTYVLWVGDSAIAATADCEAAVSLSCGEEVGEYFNQISLIATDIDIILDMDHAPGYLTGTSPIFIVTRCNECCGQRTTWSVWRYDQTYWERVFVSTLTGFTEIDWVEVSPDFDTTEAVFVANTGFDIFRSTNAGCSWKLMQYPCAPKPDISAWVVIDEDTLLCAGAFLDAGTIFKTTRHGVRPWKEYEVKTLCDGVDFDLSPNIDTDDSVLFSDDCGKVFISEDLGEEWDEVVDASDPFDAEDTYVIFDPGYGTSGDEGEFMIYAAAGTDIWRCDIDPDAKWSKQNWKKIYGGLFEATGIDAAGDTALYVADRGGDDEDLGEYDFEGTIGIMYYYAEGQMTTCDINVDSWHMELLYVDGTFIEDEPLNILSYNLQCVTHFGEPSIQGEIVVQGFSSDAIGTLYIWEFIDWFGDPTACAPCLEDNAMILISGVITVTEVPSAPAAGISSRVVRSLNPMADVSPTMKVVFEDLVPLAAGSVLEHPPASSGFHVYPDDLWLTTGTNVLWALDSAYPTYVWVWEDPLATPVIQETPSDGAQLTSTSKVVLEWEALDDADEYEINLYRYCAECPDEKLAISVDNSTDTCLIVEGLDAGTLYYWKVRVAEGEPFLSKWSELWEFTTALGKVPYLCSPWCGQEDVILTTNFSWDAVSGASAYEIEIATNEDFDPVIASGTATVNAWVASPKLDYSTTYYWRVRAVTAGVPGAWSVCIFTTEGPPAVPPEPVPPVEIPPLPAPITPLWIWVIIGIGAALTIAVVVLIVTTRRVP